MIRLRILLDGVWRHLLVNSHSVITLCKHGIVSTSKCCGCQCVELTAVYRIAIGSSRKFRLGAPAMTLIEPVPQLFQRSCRILLFEQRFRLPLLHCTRLTSMNWRMIWIEIS